MRYKGEVLKGLTKLEEEKLPKGAVKFSKGKLAYVAPKTGNMKGTVTVWEWKDKSKSWIEWWTMTPDQFKAEFGNVLKEGVGAGPMFTDGSWSDAKDNLMILFEEVEDQLYQVRQSAPNDSAEAKDAQKAEATWDKIQRDFVKIEKAATAFFKKHKAVL